MPRKQSESVGHCSVTPSSIWNVDSRWNNFWNSLFRIFCFGRVVSHSLEHVRKPNKTMSCVGPRFHKWQQPSFWRILIECIRQHISGKIGSIDKNYLRMCELVLLINFRDHTVQSNCWIRKAMTPSKSLSAHLCPSYKELQLRGRYSKTWM